MENIEYKLYTELATLLRAQFSGILVTGEYTPAPKSFPCVWIEESDNYNIGFNGANSEYATAVTYEINVFSNLKSGKKKQAKDIITFIDTKMTSWGFTRSMLSPTPNLDTTIFRYTARYTAVICDGKVYRK